jgi:hypothetical protein
LEEWAEATKKEQKNLKRLEALSEKSLSLDEVTAVVDNPLNWSDFDKITKLLMVIASWRRTTLYAQPQSLFLYCSKTGSGLGQSQTC